MTALARIAMMIVGYLLACLAASIVLTVGTLTPEWNDLFGALGVHAREVESATLWTLAGLGAVVIAVVGLLPTLLVVILAEGLALRSIIVYGVLGGALALAAAYGLDFWREVGPAGGESAHEREVFAAAGIAGGLVYWLFAGRNAGAWK